MKKIILLLSATVVLFSCSKVGKDEYIISGTATGIENGKTIILETQDANGMGLVAKDTVKVENGKFEMKGKITEPSFYTIQLEGAQAKIPFILENGEVTIAINKDSIAKSKVSGTYNNDEYATFNEEITKVQKKLIDFQTKNTQLMNTAQQTKDTAVINGLMKEFSKIQQEVGEASKAKYLTYAESHPKSFITALIVQGMLNDPSTDVKKAEAIYNGLEESLKNTKPGKAIKLRLSELKGSGVGATAPAPAPAESKWRTDFSGPNPEGKTISLKESLGKVTIVDFWASWCGPCRQENPNVVAIYKELHAKGLNIIGVSLDKDAKAWKAAIAKDKLTWNHVSNLKFWDEPIAIQYKVESIPATFILDASGKIVAKDLRGDALRAKIIELLAK
jgi:thiol-disulfide isomerase/thioredoxin